MQSYGQQPQGYQRPGSTASFAGAAAPPSYGTHEQHVAVVQSCGILTLDTASQGHQTAAPQAQTRWAAPSQSQTSGQQRNQLPQGSGEYNPGVYGVMPGAYAQGQQVCCLRCKGR